MGWNINISIHRSICSAILLLPFMPAFMPLAARAADKTVIEQCMKTRHLPDLKQFEGDVEKLGAGERKQLLQIAMELLKSDDWRQQANAAYICGLLGEEALPAVPLLISSMEAKMSNVAWAASAAIGKIGRKAVPQVISALQSAQEDKRAARNALLAVQHLGPQAVEAVPSIVPYLSDGANSGAVKALKKIGSPAVMPLCQSLAKSEDSRSFVYASEVLQPYPEEASSGLTLLLRSKTSAAVSGAAYILSQIADKQYSTCIPALVPLLRSSDPKTWQPASRAMVRIGPACAKALSPLVQDDDIEVQHRVTEILGQIGPEAGQSNSALQQALSSNNPDTASSAAGTLLRVQPGNHEALQKLLSLLGSEDVKLRMLACKALAQAGPQAAGALPNLIKALKDPDPHVREAAAIALGAIGPAAAPAVPALCEAATSTHPPINYGWELIGMDGAIHQACVIAIGNIGPKAASAIPTLLKILDEQASTRSNASLVFRALSNMKGAAAPALPAIVKQLNNKWLQKNEVIDTLLSIGTSNASIAIPELEKIVDDKTSIYRKSAFAAIMQFERNPGKKSALAARYLNDSNFELRAAATNAFSEFPTAINASESIPILIEGLKSNQHSIKLSSTKALGAIGPAASEALPLLLKDNLGSSYMRDQRKLAFEAIKNIDPDGAMTIPLLAEPLKSPFSVRAAVELLEFIGSKPANDLATSTRERWKIKS